jgi:hypothetical protein
VCGVCPRQCLLSAHVQEGSWCLPPQVCGFSLWCSSGLAGSKDLPPRIGGRRWCTTASCRKVDVQTVTIAWGATGGTCIHKHKNNVPADWSCRR